jgi:hypothetical protein
MKDESVADCRSAFLSSFILHPSAFHLRLDARRQCRYTSRAAGLSHWLPDLPARARAPVSEEFDARSVADLIGDAGAAESGSEMTICRNCGAAVREGKAFCSNCGEAVNAARAQPKEQPPEFLDTVTMPPPAQGATQTPATTAGQPRPLAHAETAPPRSVVQTAKLQRGESSLAQTHARRGFFGKRTWLVVLILLLLVVLGFVAWVVLVD